MASGRHLSSLAHDNFIGREEMSFITVVRTGHSQDRSMLNTNFIRSVRAGFRGRADSPHYTLIVMDGHTDPIEVNEPYDDFILRLIGFENKTIEPSHENKASI
jgi:hypothetical protein